MDKRKIQHIFLCNQITTPKIAKLQEELYFLIGNTFWKSPLTTASAVKSGAGLPMAALRSPCAETRDAMNSVNSLILKLFACQLINYLSLISISEKLNSLA